MSYARPKGPRPPTPSSPTKRLSLSGQLSSASSSANKLVDPLLTQDYSGRTSTSSPEGHVSNPPPTPVDHHVKIVCVGDGGCGKTCMLQTYAMGEFPVTYVPTVFENYFTKVKTPGGKNVELALWDTAGQEEYDRLRALSYPEVDIVLICFSIDSPASLDNVYDKWIPEVSHYCQGIPFILVGLKADLRQDLTTIQHLQSRGQRPITPEEGRLVGKKYGAYKCLECSAKTQTGVKDVFNTAISVVIKEKNYLTRPMVQRKYVEANRVGGGTERVDGVAGNVRNNSDSRSTRVPGKTTTNSHISSSNDKKKKKKCVIL